MSGLSRLAKARRDVALARVDVQRALRDQGITDPDMAKVERHPRPTQSLALSVAELVADGWFGEDVPAPLNRATARSMVGGSNRKRGARRRAAVIA